MRTQLIGSTGVATSCLAYGCWRVAGTWDPREVTLESRTAGRAAIRAAYEAGYTLFDHADIYCRGEAESLFGAVLREIPEMRNRVFVATKCGIRPPGAPTADSPQRWDFSAVHIERSCEESLRRLGTDAIDLLMLHRPDFLADPAEIAGAFARLQQAGKVRFFGVSNFRPSLVTALQAACPMRLVIHQVEISLARLDAFTDGTLDQCLAEKITPMAWSPLAAGLIGDGSKRLLPAQQAYRPERFLQALDTVAAARGTDRTVVALAWLRKHPSGIIPIVGSVNPDRIRNATLAADLELTREEWYSLLLAARGEPLP